MKKEQINNIVVSHAPWLESDIPTLFEGEEVLYCDAQDLPNLMVEVGAYPSTSKARHAGRQGALPQGYTEFKASKKRTLYIWNPTE
ncbi:MAG: hypothetical protein GY833_21990 [Aestuariibacter sp.]|nr:hypothetical protein [Aestuariibacter sp.]